MATWAHQVEREVAHMRGRMVGSHSTNRHPASRVELARAVTGRRQHARVEAAQLASKLMRHHLDAAPWRREIGRDNQQPGRANAGARDCPAPSEIFRAVGH